MIISGFSGNEMYCLAQKGWIPGSIVVGNSVQSLGFGGSISSSFQAVAGGEIGSLTQLITEGRHAAIRRQEKEANDQGAHGVTGVTSDLKHLGPSLKEFISIGSTVRGTDYQGPFFTTACSGQDFYCHLDAGYQPRHFVMGNVAYALGIGRGFMSMLRGFAGGEVKEMSDMYNHTRHLALERLEKEAASLGANCVVDIQTQIVDLGAGVREMLMVGTASHHPAMAGAGQRLATSELTGEELWNLTKMGYAPVRLLLGTSVYSIGIAGGIASFFKGLGRGEVDNVTQLVYQARANCLRHIHDEAEQIGADAVIGVKLFINSMAGGFLEVLAIGTAIKRRPGFACHSEQLIPQAIIRDRDTFFDAVLQPNEKELHRA